MVVGFLVRDDSGLGRDCGDENKKRRRGEGDPKG